jgi:predicted hydrolase (HD superfamily)
MDRFDALLLLRRRVRDREVVRACLAAEALMRNLAGSFDGDPDVWGLAGLLHEVDHDFTRDNPASKGRIAAEIVRTDGGPSEVAEALGGFRSPGPHEAVLTRALSAVVPAVLILLDLGPDPASLAALDADRLVALAEDPSVAPSASRTRILALQSDGFALDELLRLARETILESAADVYGA